MFSMVLGVSNLFSLTPIPIQFFPYSKLPVIEAVIEGKKYYLELDTGSAGDLVLKEEILGQMTKKEIGLIKTIDIKGNIYESFKFLISNLKICGLNFDSVSVRQENMDFLKGGCVVRDSPINQQKLNEQRHANIAGRIGWGILGKKQWYFDFSHSFLWMVDDLDRLKNEVKGFSFSDSIEVPFELENNGIVLAVETDVGLKRFMLDTGACVSCLRESLVPRGAGKEFEPGKRILVSDIHIGGKDFGPYSFFLYAFSAAIDVDGILGLQFFKRNSIYLDFQNKKATIVPAKRSFWESVIEEIHRFWGWIGSGVIKQ
jgi:hypothetical protein